MKTTLDVTTLLPLTNGALNLAADSVPGIMLADQLSRLANGKLIRVRDAVRTVEDNTVRVSGKASVLDLPEVPIALQVKPTADGLELTTAFALQNLGGTKLALATLCTKWGIRDSPTPPALTISGLTLVADTGGNFSLAATMTEKPGWTLDLGPAPLTISDVQLALSQPSGGEINGAFSGNLALGEALTLAMVCNTNGALSLEAPLPNVTLRQLIRTFSNDSIALPGSFDLAFTGGLVLIQREAGNLVFRFATRMNDLGTVLFEARRVGTAWGFVAGVGLGSVRLSKVPGLKVLAPFENIFQLQNLVLVVASFDDPGFTFPSLAVFDSPALSTGNLQLPAGGGIIKGLNISAQWKLDTTQKEQQLLLGLLHLDATLAVTLQVGAVPSQSSRLYVSYATTIGGMPFHCILGGQLNAGKVSLFLTGTLQANIQGNPVRFDATLLFVPSGAFLSGSMLGSIDIPFAHLKLSNLALAVGVNWSGVPSLGLAGTLSIDSFQSSLAVFFDSSDPTRSMLAGSVSDLVLSDVVTTLAQTSLPAELSQVLEQVALEGTSDVFMHDKTAEALDNRNLAEIARELGQAGISVPNSPEQVLLVVSKPGQKWFLTDMSTMLHYELEKLEKNIRVRLNPQLYFAPQPTKIGALEFQQAFYINGKLKILAFEAMVKILVMPTRGIIADGYMSPVVIGNENLFSIRAESDPTIGPRVSLATFSQPAAAQAVTLQEAAEAARLRGIAAAQAAQAALMKRLPFGQPIRNQTPPPTPAPQPQEKKPHFQLDGRVTFLGLQRGICVNIDNTGASFALTGSLMPGLTANLRGNISSQGALGVGGTLDVGLAPVNLGPLGILDLSSGVKGSLDLAANPDLAQATFRGQVKLPALRPAQPTNIFSLVGQAQAPQPMPELLVSLPPLTLDVKTAALASLAQQVGALVVAALKDFFSNDASKWAKYVKQGLIAGVQDIGRVLQQVYHLGAEQAAKLLKDADYAADEVGNVLKSTYGLPATETAKLLRGAGYAADQVGGALKSAYNVTADQAAQLLRGAGYAVNEVGNFVKNGFGLSPDELKSVLAGVGFATDQIKGFFNDLGGDFANVFKKMDPRSWGH